MIYRITKYDPTLRDAEGRYLPWTWTSYSDIGRAVNSCALCPAAYLETERRYTDALICILRALHVDALRVKELEPSVRSPAVLQNDFAEKGLSLSAAQADFLRRVTDISEISMLDFEVCFQLQLRECFWCRLVDPQGRAVVWFGYDYYMYMACEEIPAALVREICAGGLYVEAQTTKGSWLNQDKQANAGQETV